MIPEAYASPVTADLAAFGPYMRWVAAQARDEEPEEYRWGKRLLAEQGEEWRDLLQLRAQLGASGNRAEWLKFHSAVCGYSPDPWQLHAHLVQSFDGPRTHKLLSCGIGTGKTEWLVNEHAILHVVNPGADHLLIAPTYDQARDILLARWEAIMDAYADAGYPILRKINKSILRADLYCGGRVYFRSAEKVENLRGTEFASVGLDEGEYIRNPINGLTTLLGRLRSRNCFGRQMSVTTTPRGLTGGILEYWHKMRQAARANAKNESELARKLSTWWFNRVSSFANPRLTEDFFEALQGYSRRRFEEEVLGYPAASSVTVLPEYNAERHGIDYVYDKSQPYDLICDWGYLYPYFGWIQPRKGQHDAVLFAEYYEDQVGEERQLHALQQTAAQLGRHPSRIAVDREDPKMIERVARLFPNAHIERMEGRADQARAYGIEAVRAVVDPLFGPPLFRIAKDLINKGGKRSMHEALLGRKWAQTHGILLPWPDEDRYREHAFDALSYWARAFGRNAVVAATVPFLGSKFRDMRMQEADRWARR